MAVQSKHEIKHCPRCGRQFECKVNDVAHCQCSEVTLSNEVREFLTKTYYGCLCKYCLSELNKLVERAKSHVLPLQEEMLIEGLHYYKENDQKIYTEFYHILKGKCCEKGCKHCAYGYKKLHAQ